MGFAASSLVDRGISGGDNPTTGVSKSFVEDSQRTCARLLAPLLNADWKWLASEVVHQLDVPAQLHAVAKRWFGDARAETGSMTGIGKKDLPTRSPDSLPNDFQADVLQEVELREPFSLEAVSKKSFESDVYRQSRGEVSEGALPAINYRIKNKIWRRSVYDLHSRSWRSLPPVSCLPPPDSELFKEYSACGHGGLVCAAVSKSPKKGQLMVFDPLTGKTQVLPPLLHPRNPVLVHISVDSAKKSYRVIVAGSAAANDEHLSRKVEVFDSSTSKWKALCDLPGPAFGLNEHQAGVFLNGKLFLISFLESGGRGVIALDVESGTWLPDLSTPIPWSSYSNTLQLAESDGKLVVFAKQERGHSVDHCIDELEYQNPEAGVLTCRWRSFVKVKESFVRGLQVFAEYACAAFRKPGIFNGKKCNNLLAWCFTFFAFSPIRVCAGGPSMDSQSGMCNPPNIWESPDFAKKAAGTLLVGVAMIVLVTWGMCRWCQAPDHPFDIDGGLEASDTPTMDNPVYNILPRIP